MVPAGCWVPDPPGTKVKVTGCPGWSVLPSVTPDCVSTGSKVHVPVVVVVVVGRWVTV